MLFVRLFGLCLFRFVGFLFLLGSGKDCGLWLWHSLDFSLTFFVLNYLDKLWVFRWVRSAHRLWLICSCSIMIVTSWCLFLKKSNLVIEAFSSTSRYLDEFLNIDNNYFECLTSQIYHSQLQFNKANFLNGSPVFGYAFVYFKWVIPCKIYDKRNDFDFEIVNFPYFDEDFPSRASCGVYISQLIRFARVSSHVTDFNTWNKLLTAKLLNQGFRYHKLRKTFSKFYRRCIDLVSKIQYWTEISCTTRPIGT